MGDIQGMDGGRETYIPFDTCVVDDLVEIICRHSWLDRSCGDIEDFAGQSTDLSHGFLALEVENLVLVCSSHVGRVLGHAVLPPIWLGDGVWYLPAGREGVDGAEGAGEGVVWKGVVVSGCVCLSVSAEGKEGIWGWLPFFLWRALCSSCGFCQAIILTRHVEKQTEFIMKGNVPSLP